MSYFWEMFAVYQTLQPHESLEDTLWGQAPPKDGKDAFYPIKGKKDVNGNPLMLRKGNGDAWLKTCIKDVKIKVIGVFDTVGSLGYPDNAWKDILTKDDDEKPHGFHNTELHPRRWFT